jgi:hypothetical protein
MSPMIATAGTDFEADLPLLQASMRVNTAIFCAILGLISGVLLLLLALAAVAKLIGHAGLLVALLGVFLPLYGPSIGGAFAGLAWGCLLGALLGGGIYWLNYRQVFGHVEEWVAMDRALPDRDDGGDFPLAVLRLHGPSLGLALGAIAALGLLVTTNFLVLRGTAEESIHAKLLGQILPRYDVSHVGSLIGAAELFLLIYLLCIAFAAIYNRVALRRRAGHSR